MSTPKQTAGETARETVKFEGLLKSSYTHTEKDDNGNVKSIKNTISLFKDGLIVDGSDKVKEFLDGFYSGKAKKWVPEWYKNDNDFIVVKSAYNIPVKLEDEDKVMSFAEWVERGNIRGAKVTVKCNVKESAIYPNAMLVHIEGEPYDAFADF